MLASSPAFICPSEPGIRIDAVTDSGFKGRDGGASRGHAWGKSFCWEVEG